MWMCLAVLYNLVLKATIKQSLVAALTSHPFIET